MSTIPFKPKTSSTIICNVDSLTEEQLQEDLFHLELSTMVTHLKNKFPNDSRSTQELANVIVEELLNGSWDPINYLQQKTV